MSQISKLNYVNNKLGSSAASGQQTTRAIYDSVVTTLGPTTALPGYFEFFVSGANKDIYQTNLNTGKLDSQESMVIKEVQFMVFQSGAISYNTDGYAKIAIMNIYVGGQRVVKDFNVGTQWGTGFGPVERIFTNDGNFESKLAAVRMVTDIVIPPQVDVKVTLQYPSNFALIPYSGQSGTGEAQMMCKLLGYGTLFNAGLSF